MPILAQAELDHCFPPAHDHPGKNSGFPGRASGEGVCSPVLLRTRGANTPASTPRLCEVDAPTKVPKPIAVFKKRRSSCSLSHESTHPEFRSCASQLDLS